MSSVPAGLPGWTEGPSGTTGATLAWEQIANICWIIEKAREFQKNICFIDYAKAFDCMDLNKLWKILQEMGLPDQLTCLLRNCMQVKKQQVEPDMEQDWFQIEKGVCQGCMLSPCLFNLYAEYIMRNAELDEAQAGIKIAGGILVISDMQIIPLLWQKAKRN